MRREEKIREEKGRVETNFFETCPVQSRSGYWLSKMIISVVFRRMLWKQF
jgi:hypothetical protein